MSRHVVFTAIVLSTVSVSSYAYIPRIFRGRPKGGLLGQPGIGHLSLDAQGTVLSQAPPDQWFEQKLDHFNSADVRRWKQRYFTSGNTDNPRTMFVMIGGEGTASPTWNVVGAWVDYAKTYKAVCVQLEHRFYGKSHPTQDTSVDNLRYLSSEQALADLAAFISAKKIEFSIKKVIIFGGSYPGNLAAWFRIKYPHLVDGAVSSSAPLLAQVNFKGYLEVVKDSLDTFKPSGACNSAVANATAAIATNLQSKEGRAKLKNLFKLCDDIDLNIKEDIENLYSTLTGNFEGVVQYNKDNRAFEGAKGTNITIDTICGIMADTSVGSELERYAQVNNLLLETYEEKCQDFKYQTMIDSLRDSSWSSEAAEGGRQWTYQTCIEFGYYQSSDSKVQPFGHDFPIDFWTQQCIDIFGKEFTADFIQTAVAETNTEYGALNYTQDRVVFVNGAIDPWHYLGITSSLPQAQAIYIQGTAHCANMYPPTKDDPPGLVQARKTIEQQIKKWLS